MNSRLPLSSIAILSQSSNIIGLFDFYRIHQGGEPLVWIRPSSVSGRAQPQMLLYLDTMTGMNVIERIRLFTSSVLRLTPNGDVDSNSITEASLTRISYTVSFFNNSEEYPLYTINPDNMLPWNQTLHTSNTLLHIQAHRHYRLQNVPMTPSYMAISSNPLLHLPNRPSRRANDVCPITLDTLTPATTYWTPCGHSFSSAIQRALDEDPRCPLCRTNCYFEECARP